MASSTKTGIAGLSETSEPLVLQLQRGQVWLAREQKKFLADDEKAVSCEKFSEVLAGFNERERMLRRSGYGKCIWGPDYQCPPDAPVICDACTAHQPSLFDRITTNH